MRYFEDIVAAIEFMENHLKEDVTVQEITKGSAISSWHFQRIFHENIGETIGSYLRRRRLSCAFEELTTSSHKVIDIALDYQFGSPEAFSRAFKKEFNLSPLESRKTNPKKVPFKKAAILREQINYVVNEVTIQPTIRTIDPFYVVGFPASFVSPLAKRSEYMKSIPGVWGEFRRRESEIPHRIEGIAVGLIEGIASARHHIHDDLMDYLACVPVSAISEVPEGLQSRLIPGGKYAVFQGTGFHEQTQFLVDYVYSTWLPQASHQRTEGVEFTWLDHSVHPLDPQRSRVDYFMPIY
jgi:AraC family transcriptional regulator